MKYGKIIAVVRAREEVALAERRVREQLEREYRQFQEHMEALAQVPVREAISVMPMRERRGWFDRTIARMRSGR